MSHNHDTEIVALILALDEERPAPLPGPRGPAGPEGMRGDQGPEGPRAGPLPERTAVVARDERGLIAKVVKRFDDGAVALVTVKRDDAGRLLELIEDWQRPTP